MYVSQAKDIAAAKHIKIIVPEVLLSGEQMKRNKTDRENKCLVVRNQMRNKNKNNQKKELWVGGGGFIFILTIYFLKRLAMTCSMWKVGS